MSLTDEDITTEWHSGPGRVRAQGDTDTTDSTDTDGTDSTDVDGTDTGDADTTDAGDADTTDT